LSLIEYGQSFDEISLSDSKNVCHASGLRFVTPCGLYDTALKDTSQKQVYNGYLRV